MNYKFGGPISIEWMHRFSNTMVKALADYNFAGFLLHPPICQINFSVNVSCHMIAHRTDLGYIANNK